MNKTLLILATILIGCSTDLKGVPGDDALGSQGKEGQQGLQGPTGPQGPIGASTTTQGWAYTDIGGNLVGGTNLTVTKGTSGRYYYKFETPQSSIVYSAVCTIEEDDMSTGISRVCTINNKTVNGFIANIYTTTTASLANNAHNVIVIGNE